MQIVPDAPRTDMGWEVRPAGLHDLLVRVAADYHPPTIYVTENGAAYDDPPDASGRIDDVRRIDFLRGHLLALGRALDAGVPVAGYFHWSLLDNFEWGHGYGKRFGLVHVDFASQRRTCRASATFYRDVVATRAVDPSP